MSFPRIPITTKKQTKQRTIYKTKRQATIKINPEPLTIRPYKSIILINRCCLKYVGSKYIQ